MPPLLPAAALLISSALSLTGCAPEEKTMLLPQASLSQSEDESQAAVDYTVDRIYTYSYDTLPLLGKSAFLSGCGDNEIHILSLEGQEAESALGYRQVDYRYGFYDAAGEFRGALEHWTDWGSPGGGEMEGDLYIDSLLPSPDGRQLLVYIKSAFWDSLTVRLYSLGEQEPLLLYEGTAESADVLRGSFSPEGRWVTFDAGGASASLARLVPLYDCSRRASQDSEFWWLADTASRLLAPDQALYSPSLLHATEKNESVLWDAGLYDHSGSGGLIGLFRESDGSLCITRYHCMPGQESAPEASLLEEKTALLDSIMRYEESVPVYEGTPFPQYRYSSDGTAIYYLSNPSALWRMETQVGDTAEMVVDFPDPVWDFLPLPSGDVLAALVQETESAFEKNTETAQTENYIQQNASPASLQELWGILSSDLYIYSQGDSERHLLYKNLQNLLGMEYDQETGRILLETYEGRDRGHRRCIVLEL